MTVLNDLVEELTVRGSGLRADVARAVSSWALDLDMAQTSQLTVTIEDPGLSLLGTGVLAKGAHVTWRDLDLVVAVIEVGLGEGAEQVRVIARSRGWQALRRTTGARVWRNISPSELAASEARRVGLTAVVEPSARRTEIQRTAEAGQPPETSVDVLDRVAAELGYVVFEAAGTLYFGRPTWLVGRSRTLGTLRRLRWPKGGDHDLTSLPECRDSDDADAVTIEANLLVSDLVAYRPGHGVNFAGIRGFDGSYIVSRVSYRPGDPTGTLSLVTPVDPAPRRDEADGVRVEAASSVTADWKSTPWISVPSGSTPPVAPGSAGIGPAPGGYRRPVPGRITSGFGPRNGGVHEGIDIACPVGTPVVAAKAGTVSRAGTVSGYGYVVYVDHPGGSQTRYAHLSIIGVKAGDRVVDGAVVGESGGAKGAPGAGNSQGPHLHFEVREGGVAKDPAARIT